MSVRRDAPAAALQHLADPRRTLSQGVDYVLLAADPRPLHPRFFSDRIEGVSAGVSKQLFSALKGGGFLDGHNYLVENPRWVPH
jgi:hypothetical protein